MYTLLQGIDTPKDPSSGAVPTLSLEHAEIHAGRSFLLSGILSVGIADVGAAQITVPAEAAAAVTVTMDGANSNMTYTADTKGRGGNDISVVHVATGNNTPLTVSRVGNAITIGLETGAGGAVESTAAEVAAAVNAHPEISRVLTATTQGDGSGVVEAKDAANLTGGVDRLDVHFKAASVSVTDGEMTAIFKEDSSFSETTDVIVPVNRHRRSDNKSQTVCKSNADATVVNGDNKVDIVQFLLGAASPGNQRITGSQGADEEIELKQGLNYLLEVTNNAGTAEKVNFILEWYERSKSNFRSF